MKGLFLSSPVWSSALTSLASGWMVDRLGYRLQVLLSSLLQAAGLMAVAMASDQLDALVGGAVSGLGRGMMTPPMTALMCSLYAENRVRIVNLHHSSWYIGMVVFLLFTLGVLELGIGWRTLFAMFAGLVLLYSPAAMLRFLPGPRVAKSEDAGERLSFWRVARHRDFRLLAVSLFFCSITEVTAASWLPYYLEAGIGSSRSQGAVGLTVFAAVMAVGRLSMPLVVRRIGLRSVFIVTGLACIISSPLAAWHDNPILVVVWLSVLGFAVSSIYPSTNAHAGDRFPKAGSAMFAMLNSTGLLGALVGPVVFGSAADFVGLRWAMALMAVAPLMWMVGLLRAVREKQQTLGEET